MARRSGVVGGSVTVRWARDADEQLQAMCRPECEETAQAIADAIPGHAPGHMGSTYSPSVRVDGDGIAHVDPGSSFWHWLEYGTAYSPPYRPIENACRGLGLDYRPM